MLSHPTSPERARIDALEHFVNLLSEADVPAPSRAFYDRLCEASCRLAGMQRAMLFVYDPALRRVRVAGCHGVAPGAADDLHVTVDEAPIARRALTEDRVVEVSEDIESEVPPAIARMFGITTLTCTPLSAAGRWFGVMCADRGGGRYELTADERHAMWTLGKMGALAASTGVAIRQSERARVLAERIDLARDIHERVIQRLFGVVLTLGAPGELDAAERAACRDELRGALDELREALGRPLARDPRPVGGPLRAELERLVRAYPELPTGIAFEDGLDVPAELEPLAQRLVGEALRNAHKHATPKDVDIRVGRSGDALCVEVSNDGAEGSAAAAGARMGLRLLAFEAVQHGAVLEFGPKPGDRWQVRLVAPLE